jgi:hypothetical protein
MASNEREREDPRVFEWRKQQFLRFRKPPEGLTLTQARTLALQSSVRLGELSEATRQIAETPPLRDVELEVPEGSSGSVKTAPRPRSAPVGLVGQAAAVKLKLRSGDDAIFKIRFEERDQRRVVAQTVRVFEIDGGEWRIMPRSDAASDETHVWCLLATGGMFAAAGILRERSVIAGLLASYDLRSFFYPLFRERQGFSQAIESLAKSKNWRALAKRSGPIFDEADSAELESALDRLRRNASSLAKIKSGKKGPIEWQILESLVATPDGQRLLTQLEALVERGQQL